MKTKLSQITLVASLMTSGLVVASGVVSEVADPGAMQGKHFDFKGEMPSSYTVELQNGLRKTLPFEDKRDFEESQKGFIAVPAYKTIMADAGNVAWGHGQLRIPLAGQRF
jgi:alkyl sulfatase BDS1-like metallo-beta-lactamase superfamily hydrolase